MAQKSHGSQHGARKKLSSDGSKPTINDHMKNFEEGEKVLIKLNGSVQGGRVHSRFHGRTAEVVGKQGDAYRLKLKDGGKEKNLNIKPIHLQKTE
ncbi:MAG: 50S ribosomal protein L21e [Candidatus Nanohaloarchaea archaeon]